MKRHILLFSVVTIIMGLVFTIPAFAGKPAPEPKHVIIVSADGNGDFTTIGDALASITDNAATNPYLIKINPGIYDVGSTPVVMKQYVDIEGSGENVTTITGTVDDGNTRSSGVVITAPYTELRDVTVENTGGGLGAIALLVIGNYAKVTNVTAKASGADWNYAIYSNGYDARIQNVTATASGSITPGYGQNHGIFNESRATMVNIKASAINGHYNQGLYNFNTYNNVSVVKNAEVLASGGTVSVAFNNYDSRSELVNVQAVAQNATNNNIGFENYIYVCTSCTAKVDNSSISGTPHAIMNFSTNTVVTSLFLGSTKIEGAISLYNTSVKCFGVYDGNYDPYTCP